MTSGVSYRDMFRHTGAPCTIIALIGFMIFATSVSITIVFDAVATWGVFGQVVAAIVFAVGVCHFWPTMLGFISEYLPKTDALGLSIPGGAGMVGTSFVLPIMGHSIDTAGPSRRCAS